MDWEDLPVRMHELLVIEHAQGIRDLCRIGMDMHEVLMNLGRPDDVEYFFDSYFTFSIVKYDRFGLTLWGTGLKLVSMTFEDFGNTKIRLCDEKASPEGKSIRKVTGFYGDPERESSGSLEEGRSWISKHQDRFDLVYPFETCYHYFSGVDDEVRALIICDKDYPTPIWFSFSKYNALVSSPF